jgi:hypothetical protein
MRDANEGKTTRAIDRWSSGILSKLAGMEVMAALLCWRPLTRIALACDPTPPGARRRAGRGTSSSRDLIRISKSLL